MDDCFLLDGDSQTLLVNFAFVADFYFSAWNNCRLLFTFFCDFFSMTYVGMTLSEIINTA